MLRREVEGDADGGTAGLAEKLKLDWTPDQEPALAFETNWLQARDSQLTLLDTFFGALRPEESLCFFYAKRTPLSEQSRRVIVGVGRVLSIGQPTEYSYTVPDPPLRCMLWERNVGHSVRPGFTDGFLFPYQKIAAQTKSGGFGNPEDFVAFAPDDQFEAYSYGSELLTHDGAVASLIACAAVLQRLIGKVEGPWTSCLAWVNQQLNRLWTARGPFPGLGSALAAFGYEWGFQHGSLLAYEIALAMEDGSHGDDPWPLVDAVMADPSALGSGVAQLLTPSLRNGWKALGAERRLLLRLLGRCAINEEQALRLYDRLKRTGAGIDLSDRELLDNPYLLFEADRRSYEPISFGAVDRGVFPDEALRKSAAIEGVAELDDPADPRRVRGLVVDLLEQAAQEGHSLLPRDWIIQRARSRALQPPCPLGDAVLDATEGSFGTVVGRVTMKSGAAAYQIDRLSAYRDIIRREVLGRKKGKPHGAELDWHGLVRKGLGDALPTEPSERELEEKARAEKGAALEQLFRSRLCVLIGAAGTGKTTLLRMLCDLPEVASKGLLLLAPTGKARVRLEEQTGQRGAGKTLAQFLNQNRRYNGKTGAYFTNAKAPRCGDFRTVIVDECSMLTEDQLAALFDACTNVERYILVGDPRQLPPIGAGRPFVDIVGELAPPNAESEFPRAWQSYVELTIPRRQTAGLGRDVLLGAHFSGRPLDPGADEVWHDVGADSSDRLRLVEWTDPQDLQSKLIDELVSCLELSGTDDELGFELSLGGKRYKDLDRAFFGNKYGDNPGAASKVEAWQILSPVHDGLEGVTSLNRHIQGRFRRKWRAIADLQGWNRTVPKPIGPGPILYGDKVINIVNQKRLDVWPAPDGEAYIANGDLGIVVGQYKKKSFKGLPWKLQVEFAGQLGHMYGFSKGEFGDDATNPLELAYTLTVHKTQGSEFGTTFVVLPNPCWLLSRELLYTALTRHRDRLVVLHQGPLSEFRRYASEEYSEIARRMTNLFTEPSPREVVVGTETRFLEEGLIHRTERGELVRSKSELVIADKLHARGIEYKFEQPFTLSSSRTCYPDFTIADHARGVTFYWEHLGMLEDPAYRARWERKRSAYIASGVLPASEGGGPEGTLIETRDDPRGGLDAKAISEIIERLILG
jgi:hypothetical protein